MSKGKLYIVSIPIGNESDYTLRGLEVLKTVDVIIAEENKSAKKLLASLKIQKDYFILNEHNEESDADHVVGFMEKGEDVALVSDCGTPVFADPGRRLVDLCHERKITVVPVPGVSSLLAGLVVSGFDITKFRFAGFLSPKADERKSELVKFEKSGDTLFLMETPYRRDVFLDDVAEVFSSRRVCFVFKATTEEEQIIRGHAKEVANIVKEKDLQGEFVIVIEGKNKQTSTKKSYHKKRRSSSRR